MSSPNQLSFLPEDYLQRKAQQRTNVIFAMLFLIVGVAIVGTFTLDDRSMRALEVRHAEIAMEYEEAARRIEQVKEMQNKQRTLAQQAELTASLLEKVPRSFLMAEITNSLPAGVSLLDFGLESKRRLGPPPAPKSAFDQRRAAMDAARRPQPAATPQAEPMQFDVSMKMSGIARTDVQVAQFMSQLTRSDLLTDVNLVITDVFELQGDKLRRFQIEMNLNPHADVQTAPRKDLHTVSVELQ